nr:mitogen-activated protein kinase kinase 4-like [Ipomoea trifida]
MFSGFSPSSPCYLSFWYIQRSSPNIAISDLREFRDADRKLVEDGKVKLLVEATRNNFFTPKTPGFQTIQNPLNSMKNMIFRDFNRGTRYLPPEYIKAAIAKHDVHVSTDKYATVVDIWSIGITIWELYLCAYPIAGIDFNTPNL